MTPLRSLLALLTPALLAACADPSSNDLSESSTTFSSSTTSSDGEASRGVTGADDDTTGLGAITTESTGDTAHGDTTSESGAETSDTGIECPDNPCTSADASDMGYCVDGTTLMNCEPGPDGCLVPTVEVTCEDECLKGICCSNGFGEPRCSCVSNECIDNGFDEGWHCLPNGQTVRCANTSSCLRPAHNTLEDCPADLACDPSTGTCGGCNPDDPCFGYSEGFELCASAPGLNEATCGLVNGCLTETNVTGCQSACVFGQGCCGGLGDVCCHIFDPPCFDGLACVDGTCQ
ncbi:MAG: hypothetical protein AAGF11_37500 [Myxococcota bacterium]